MSLKLLAYFGVFLLLVQCKRHESLDKYGPLYVINDTTMYIDGDMGSRIDLQMEEAFDNYPSISYVEMYDCPGSKDDDALMDAGRLFHSKSIHVHLPSNASIASGAVDLFLAGTERSKDNGAEMGVHSWSEGDKEATDFPPGHQYHALYIDYYQAIGRSSEQADSLYWFTINAAGADDIHIVTEEEIDLYDFLTD